MKWLFLVLLNSEVLNIGTCNLRTLRLESPKTLAMLRMGFKLVGLSCSTLLFEMLPSNMLHLIFFEEPNLCNGKSCALHKLGFLSVFQVLHKTCKSFLCLKAQSRNKMAGIQVHYQCKNNKNSFGSLVDFYH